MGNLGEYVQLGHLVKAKTRHRIARGGDSMRDFKQVRYIPHHSIVSLSANMSRLLPVLRW